MEAKEKSKKKIRVCEEMYRISTHDVRWQSRCSEFPHCEEMCFRNEIQTDLSATTMKWNTNLDVYYICGVCWLNWCLLY